MFSEKQDLPATGHRRFFTCVLQHGLRLTAVSILETAIEPSNEGYVKPQFFTS
jgi:hypothetical protein